MYQTIQATTVSASSKSAGAKTAAVLLFDQPRTTPASLAAIDRAAGGALTDAIKRHEFSAAPAAVATLYPGKTVARLIIGGLGASEKMLGSTLVAAAAAVVNAAWAARVDRIRLDVDGALIDRIGADRAGRLIGEGAALATFDFTDFKGAAGGNGANTNPVKRLTVELDAALLKPFKRGVIVGESTNFARQLAATPPNVANPAFMISQCRAMAKKFGLGFKLIDHKQAKTLGMGGLLAVGAGGSTPPAVICLEHRLGPASASKRSKTTKKSTKKSRTKAPLLLVGKGVTFDTGGYSIKPGAGMARMKYDMCGAAAVIGAMRAIAALDAPGPVVGVIPVAENMIDTTAYRPDDIVTFCNGVTAEITNTDAEGRIILADALAWSTKHYSPRAVVDLATLTGGVITALGGETAGAFVDDADLHKSLFDAAEFAGEKLWRLPLWDEHRAMMKGNHADLVNSAGREAHPIQGAAFLSFFVGEDAPTSLPKTPWCHLDIAGPSTSDRGTPPYGKGPTGYGVRTLVRAVEEGM